MLNKFPSLIRCTCVAAAIIMFSSFTNAPAAPQKNAEMAILANSELILQFPKIDEKSYPQIRGVLAGINGVTIDGYCTTNQVFILIIDRTILPGDEPIFTALKAGNCGEYNVKTGSTAAAVYSTCSDVR